MHKNFMLSLFLILFLICHAAAALATADVKLAWDPNSEPHLQGYYVHYGTTPGTYDHKENAYDQTTYTVEGLTEGTTYYFAVTAYSETTESDYSIELPYQVPLPGVTYTLTASAGANGAISPSDNVTVNQGSSQTYTITPDANYHIDNVLVDGAPQGPINSYTFTNILANHTISATFAENAPTDYTITASAGANGAISPSGSVTVDAGSSETFSIIPNANYHVTNVTVDGTSKGAISSYNFENVTADHTISASFAINTYTIAASDTSNGTISPSGEVSANAGQNKTFTITPAANYHVDNVLVDGAPQGPITSYTFSNVLANHTISATFAIDTYTIAASAGNNGTISPSGEVSANAGQNKIFTITPAANYHVDNVLVDGAPQGPITSYTFSNVLANHTISATFAIDTYTIAASAGNNGTISPSGEVSANAGQNKIFTITPAANYHVDNVLVDGAPQGPINSYTFSNVLANHTISATFAENAPSTYTITATAGSNGAISPSGSVTVDTGTSQSFDVTPAANYHIADVLVDGASIGAVGSHTFSSVTANHTISATFAIDTYTIAASAGGNGTISPSGEVSANAGQNKTFTITPNANYHVDNVFVNGAPQGPINKHTFANIHANHAISASFAQNAPSSFTITATAGANGTISPSGSVGVDAGASQSFTISPSRLYQIDDVQIDGVSIGAVNSYTLCQVNKNHTITVTFKIGFPICTEATLAWNEAADPAVTGYKVHYGKEPSSYSNSINVGPETSCTIAGLDYNRKYYFKITAYGATGETDYSDEFYQQTCKYKKISPPLLKLMGSR